MGGTGGPGSSRTEAQQGLQGAGLLSGEGPLAPSATSRALGVEGAAQPATTQLSGTSTGPVATPLPTSASDTPVVPTTTPAAATAPPPQSSFGLATAPAIANTPFALPTVSNLGLPSSDMPLGEVHHVPFGTPAATVAAPTVAAAPPPTVSAAAGSVAAAANAQSPSDWLYPGNLPMNFHGTGAEFGMPVQYAATGENYTAGYGAVGPFGGQAGYGPQQEGLKDQVLLPQMAAGTQLTGSQIDQYNRVSRADYDRYMKLYGVGYDLPAYRNALNGLVYQQNMRNYTPGGGG